jgi:pimeloyl-ACP methyl ester carboxylesterase
MMAPDTFAAQAVSIVLAVVAATATALLWDRMRRWWGVVAKVLAVVVCVGLAFVSGGVALNRELELFGSWDSVVTAGGGRIVSFTVDGRASGLSLPVYTYLPPGYDDPALRGQRLPVIEAFHGFPGSPGSWLKTLTASAYLDQEIEAHRMAPVVVVFPVQTVSRTRDSECVDAIGGIEMDTFLSVDVPWAVIHDFRVRDDAAGWGTIGYSTGGFCAVNLAMRHPTRYSAAASLSGYFHAITDKTTGDLYRGSAAARDENSPLWRLKSLPIPPIAVYLAAAMDDRVAYSDVQDFAMLARPPMSVTTATVPVGGHSKTAWRAMEPAAFDWLASWLAAPQSTDRVTATGRPRLTLDPL